MRMTRRAAAFAVAALAMFAFAGLSPLLFILAFGPVWSFDDRAVAISPEVRTLVPPLIAWLVLGYIALGAQSRWWRALALAGTLLVASATFMVASQITQRFIPMFNPGDGGAGGAAPPVFLVTGVVAFVAAIVWTRHLNERRQAEHPPWHQQDAGVRAAR